MVPAPPTAQAWIRPLRRGFLGLPTERPAVGQGDRSMTIWIVLIVAIALVVLVLASASIRIAREYERGVVFRLGRLSDLKGPGLFLIFPFGVDRLTKVDLRVITLEVPPQEVITSDNVTVKVNAVIFFQVLDPRAAITRVYNFGQATSQIALPSRTPGPGQS